jgi:hypothetical protein
LPEFKLKIRLLAKVRGKGKGEREKGRKIPLPFDHASLFPPLAKVPFARGLLK